MDYFEHVPNKDKTARELATSRDEPQLVFTGLIKGVRFRVISRHSHFTAYIGFDEHSNLYRVGYDELYDDFHVHGDLTFASMGEGILLSEDIWWLGWDYAHAGDFIYLHHFPDNQFGDKDWTLGEIIEDCMPDIMNQDFGGIDTSKMKRQY